MFNLKIKFKFVGNVINQLKSTLRDDASQYRFTIALRMVGNLVLTILLCAFLIHLFITINILFFEANGFPRLDVMREAFFDYIYGKMSSYSIYLFGFLLFYFFVGIYIAELSMRPFRLVAAYCQQKIEGKDATYNPGFYSDLQLLTNFCEFFFNFSRAVESNKKLISMPIPDRYKSIHRPMFERSFYIHYSAFILISSLITATALFYISAEIYENVITLAVSYLKQRNMSEVFFTGQSDLYSAATILVLSLHLFLSFLLTFRIHTLVSTPGFGIFSTLRSFVKGQYHSRVHLIGSYFLRNECRIINQYLDYLQENYSDKR